MNGTCDLNYQKFFNYLCGYGLLSEKLIEEIWECGQLRDYLKGEIIVGEGCQSKTLFFVMEGFCSCFFSKEGRENIMRFIGEGEFCLLHHSFLGNEKSLFNIRATERTTLLCISRESYNHLWNDFPDFKHIIHKVLEQQIIEDELRYYRLRSCNAEERIKKALEMREIQKLIKRVPQYYIASYLDMAPETFAKIFGMVNKSVL